MNLDLTVSARGPVSGDVVHAPTARMMGTCYLGGITYAQNLPLNGK